MARLAVSTADVEPIGHTRAWATAYDLHHALDVSGDADRTAVCMLGHDVADEVGWHIRPVASEVLADAGDQCFLVAVTLVHG